LESKEPEKKLEENKAIEKKSPEIKTTTEPSSSPKKEGT